MNLGVPGSLKTDWASKRKLGYLSTDPDLDSGSEFQKFSLTLILFDKICKVSCNFFDSNNVFILMVSLSMQFYQNIFEKTYL